MPTKKLTMTEADGYALSKMPSGWFEYRDISHAVRCPEFRLQRLVERGKVERKLQGEYPDCSWLYRVKEGTTNAD